MHEPAAIVEQRLAERLSSGAECDRVDDFSVAGQPLGQALLDNRGRLMHAAGHLVVDRWQGEERVQMRLVDVARS